MLQVYVYLVVIVIHYCTIYGIEIKESTQKGAAIIASYIANIASYIANSLLFSFLVLQKIYSSTFK